MNENGRILNLANMSIAQMEKALADPSQLMDKSGRLDIKALKDYGATMKSMMEIIREAKTEQLLMEPIEVIMGEGEKYAN